MDRLVANHDFLTDLSRKYIANHPKLAKVIFKNVGVTALNSELNVKSFIELEPNDHFNESQMEHQLSSCLGDIYKDYTVIPFTKAVEHSTNKTARKPDLAIIKNDFTQWFIVEVELAGHSSKHVEAQIETFCNGLYDSTHADYMATKNKVLPAGELRKMVASIQNKTMVIINRDDRKIRESLEKFDCEILTFQIYEDESQNQVFRLFGKYPRLNTKHAVCTINKTAPRDLLNVHGGRELFGDIIQPTKEIDIEYIGKRYKASICESNNEIFIQLSANYAVLDRTRTRYQLRQKSSGDYLLNNG